MTRAIAAGLCTLSHSWAAYLPESAAGLTSSSLGEASRHTTAKCKPAWARKPAGAHAGAGALSALFAGCVSFRMP